MPRPWLFRVEPHLAAVALSNPAWRTVGIEQPAGVGEAQRAHPGIGGPKAGGFLPSIHELSSTFGQVLVEELDRRLEEIPREELGKRYILLVFGQPGSGKTTLAHAALRLPQVAAVIERVGGD